MSLDVDVRLRRGTFALEAAFTAGPGLTALFGPSGSGKTTLVDLIAGLVQPDAGRIAVDGRVLVDTARGLRVPVHRRRIGYVFQDARLLPHLSVRRNLAYGQWFAPRSGRAGGEVAAVVDLLGLAPLLERLPHTLSGGERQRVAIGRALLSRPSVLLMDEPLSALDAARRNEVLPYIERLRDAAGVPIVYVSHTASEVARLATTAVIVKDGRVVARGPAGPLVAPRSSNASEEAAAFLTMRIEGHEVREPLTRLVGPAGRLIVPRLPLPLGATIRVGLAPRDILVATHLPHGLSARNVLPGRIAAIAAEGLVATVRIACGDVALTARLPESSARDLALRPDLAVFVVIRSARLDAEGTSQNSPVEI